MLYIYIFINSSTDYVFTSIMASITSIYVELHFTLQSLPINYLLMHLDYPVDYPVAVESIKIRKL